MRATLRELARWALLLAVCATPSAVHAQGAPYPSSGGGGVTGLTGGSTVVATVPYLAPNGSCAAPSFAWNSDADGTGSGWYRQAANIWSLCLNGVEIARFTGTELRLLNSATLWNRTYRDTTGSQRLDFGASSANEYTGQSNAISTAHIFSSQTALSTIGKIVSFRNDFTNERMGIDGAGVVNFDSTDSSGTPGAATINKPSGRTAVAAAAASVVVTNSRVTAATKCYPVIAAADATCTTVLRCVPGAGSFTITLNAACTGATAVDWHIFN